MLRKLAGNLLAGYYWVIVAVLFLPIVLLILFSFNDSTRLVFPLRGFTLQWYRQLGDNPEMLDALKNSLLLAAVSSMIATLLGAMGALAIVRFRFPGSR